MSDLNPEALELERLRSECCRCLKCGHVQAEPNWCHLCGHRTEMPPWAAALIDELHAAKDEAEMSAAVLPDRGEEWWLCTFCLNAFEEHPGKTHWSDDEGTGKCDDGSLIQVVRRVERDAVPPATDQEREGTDGRS